MKRYFKEIDGKTVYKTRQQIVITKDGMNTYNPTEEMILSDGWRVYIPQPVEPYIPTYEERVEQLIRERYSLNEELAIQRQRDTKVDEFNAYYEYCEECKQKAKEEL